VHTLNPILERASAVIFDMDGVLADTEPVYEQALGVVLARRNAAVSSTEYAALVGLTNEATWRWVVERFGLAESPEQLFAESEPVLMRALSGGIVAAPGAIELVRTLHSRGIPQALGSSATRHAVETVLTGLGLADAFSAVVSGDDVRQGKPDPAIFLEAARRLGVATSATVVIEDSLPGLRAGRLAGMTTVGVRSRYTANVELPADLIVESLTELLHPREISPS
jgi:HAD superfamily hydrolase (TIGR01509 family)